MKKDSAKFQILILFAVKQMIADFNNTDINISHVKRVTPHLRYLKLGNHIRSSCGEISAISDSQSPEHWEKWNNLAIWIDTNPTNDGVNDWNPLRIEDSWFPFLCSGLKFVLDNDLFSETWEATIAKLIPALDELQLRMLHDILADPSYENSFVRNRLAAATDFNNRFEVTIKASVEAVKGLLDKVEAKTDCEITPVDRKCLCFSFGETLLPLEDYVTNPEEICCVIPDFLQEISKI